MGDEKAYIEIITDSLKKKIRILDQMILKNDEQKNIIGVPNPDMAAFEKTEEEKTVFINELKFLDEGFQTVYDRIKTEFLKNRNLYKEEIRTLQSLIKDITDRSMTIQSQEERNRNDIQRYFSNVRKNIRQAKTSNKVAAGYYKSMSRLDVIEPQFMDKKK